MVLHGSGLGSRFGFELKLLSIKRLALTAGPRRGCSAWAPRTVMRKTAFSLGRSAPSQKSGWCPAADPGFAHPLANQNLSVSWALRLTSPKTIISLKTCYRKTLWVFLSTELPGLSGLEPSARSWHSQLGKKEDHSGRRILQNESLCFRR